jgi:hypothetical protein
MAFKTSMQKFSGSATRAGSAPRAGKDVIRIMAKAILEMFNICLSSRPKVLFFAPAIAGA